MGSCHTKGKERGAWYEIQTVRDVILRKEAKGEDATFERDLLKAWSKYPGYEDALEPILVGVANRKIEA
jgi:hypothetical protein